MKKFEQSKKMFFIFLVELIAINFIFGDIIYSQSIDCGLISTNSQSYSGPFRGLFKPIRSDISGDVSAPS